MSFIISTPSPETPSLEYSLEIKKYREKQTVLTGDHFKVGSKLTYQRVCVRTETGLILVSVSLALPALTVLSYSSHLHRTQRKHDYPSFADRKTGTLKS